MTDEKQFRADMQSLMRTTAFKRFLWRVIQSAGLLDRTTDGSDGRDRYNAGRRDLGLEILDLAEQGQPIQDLHPDQIPLLSLIQIFVEETQRPPEEKPSVRKPSYDRTDDLRDEGDVDDADGD